ncbi:hypothetical protein AOLI_G00187680 [Acnodon oligacanthus]
MLGVNTTGPLQAFQVFISSMMVKFNERMNKAPTAGFEKDVGTKTTHHATYPESAVDMDNSTHLILLPFKILDLEWLISVFTT